MIGLDDLRGLSGPSASVTRKPATRGQQRLACHWWGCERGVMKNLLKLNKSVSSGKNICHWSLEAGVTASFSSTTSWRWCLWRTWLDAIWNEEGIGHQSCLLHCNSCHQELWRNVLPAALSVSFGSCHHFGHTPKQQQIPLCRLQERLAPCASVPLLNHCER